MSVVGMDHVSSFSKYVACGPERFMDPSRLCPTRTQRAVPFAGLLTSSGIIHCFLATTPYFLSTAYSQRHPGKDMLLYPL